MKYQTIHIEGAILAADIFDKIESANIIGQKPADFGLSGNVKDDIANAWADAQSYWKIYQRRTENLKPNQSGVSETRNHWIVPLLGLLGYNLDVQQRGEIVNNKNYHISHRDTVRDNFPVHVMGFNDSLDAKRSDSGPRMSPHALLQEYLNLTEHLYGIVTNGLRLRLLRDSSRLIKLSYIEFDLERMIQENHFADFAILYRILHASRMPVNQDSVAESLIETYHQDSLDSGSRIRNGLAIAVEKSIVAFANGFLNNPANENLRQKIRDDDEHGGSFVQEFYKYQLHLIYRLLFLMVIEERDLIYPNKEEWGKLWESVPQHIKRIPLKNARDIFYNYYSVNRLRKLAGKRWLADSKLNDYWIALKNTFRLFENENAGAPLGIKPLSGDLFSYSAIGILNECELDNSVIIECLTDLSIFENPDSHQKIRVNYGALNVEEFGSVYESLLEYDPHISFNGNFVFSFQEGSKRSSSGSHYTPDELVVPLIKHSLNYLLEDRIKIINDEIKTRQLKGNENRESRKKLLKKHLLSLTVCDVACGSGHILLNAARRIATEYAVIIEEEDQPTPASFRKAIRVVIGNCIYGVDLNPLAVELCKVALWLEAHNPNEPLNFLDHHIKCGNAIVGLAHQNELQNGIATEAFNSLPGDDKTVATKFRNLNKKQIKERKQKTFGDFSGKINQDMKAALLKLAEVNAMPENSIDEIENKKLAYKKIGFTIRELRIIADIQTAQFFIPKTEENSQTLITDEKYFEYLRGAQQVGPQIAKIEALAQRKRFFHWFLEFPQIIANGGFDCILGNPPFLGGQKLSGAFGNSFCEYIQFQFAPIGSVDLVTYFFRRIFTIIKSKGFQALISTNTIAQGDSRKGGLAVINGNNGAINFAVRSMKWPGLAAVEVALVAIYKGKWNKEFVLDNKKVKQITSYLDNTEYLGEPYQLKQNENKSFQGSIVLGKGFVLTPEKASELIYKNSKNKDVLFPYLNGQDLNNNIDQSPSRWVINFFDWDEDFCRGNYPDCFEIVERDVKQEREEIKTRKKQLNSRDEKVIKFYWRYEARRPNLYRTIAPLDRVLVVPCVAKYSTFDFVSNSYVFMHKLIVIPFDNFISFTLLVNTIHHLWSWKNSSTLGGSTLNYSPTDCFQTFPFPQKLSSELKSKLEKIGEEYHEFRRLLMLKLQLGLTKTYNQFHNRELRILTEEDFTNLKTLNKKAIEKKYGKETFYLYNHLTKKENTCTFNEAVTDILKLRELHKQMDEAVLEAYGWHQETPALQPLGEDKIGVKIEGTWPAIDLQHDFYEVEYLPENDRIRYTIPPQVRKEILKRLLLLNHKIYAKEVAQGLHDKKKGKKKAAKKKTATTNKNQIEMELTK